MAFITADRVKDTSTTTGTGNITVSGSAPFGYRTFSTVLSAGDTFYYCIQGQASAEWEIGIGTYASTNQFARTTVLSSSASGSAVSFLSGTKNVFITLAAAKTLQLGPSDGPTAGSVPYGTGSTLAYTAAGTSGQVLTSSGSSAPTWTSVSSLSPTSISNGTSNVSIASANGAITAVTAGATAMTINTSGNVGIGTTAPGAKLESKIASTANGSPQMRAQADTANLDILAFGSTATTYGMWLANEVGLFSNYNINFMSNGGSGVIKFSTGGASERMRIDSSGNVGIGTSSPGAKLSFGQTVQTNLLYIYDGTAGAKYGFGIASSELRIYSGSSASTTIGNFDGTTYTERMRIDSSGNVGIGTSSPTSYVNSGSGFAVVGTNSQTQVFLGSSASGVNVAAYTGAVYFQSTTSADFLIGSSTANPVIFRTNATERMRIDSSGNVGIGATANASAILDAQSTTKGVRFPNMTTTQKNAISSPAAGLVVFDTTLSKLCVYSGAAWQTITSI